MFDKNTIEAIQRGAGIGDASLAVRQAFAETLQFNARRADHKLEHRSQPGGKAF